MIDYDNAPTDPHHGGKLMPHQMPARIEELEAKLADIMDWYEDVSADYNIAYMEKVVAEAKLEKVFQMYVDANEFRLELDEVKRLYRVQMDAYQAVIDEKSDQTEPWNAWLQAGDDLDDYLKTLTGQDNE